VAAVGEIAPGTGRAVDAGGERVAVFNDGGTYRAVDDACPHQGASLGEGFLLAGNVVCPRHAWAFDLKTGDNPRVPGSRVSCYAVRVCGDAIEVEIPEASGSA
jgi:nitrite reductase/ring-hydroxylating ferredoxin subunit